MARTKRLKIHGYEVTAVPSGSGLTPIPPDSPYPALSVGDIPYLGFNVLDYGAVGDGVTDDTAAVQKAFTAAQAAGGGSIIFPAGSFLISSTIELVAKTTIQGAGVGATTIKCPSSMSDPIFRKVMSTTDYLYDWTIRDFTMDGVAGAATRGIEINSNASSAITYFNNLLTHVSFRRFYVAVCHVANNANAGAMYNNTNVSYCWFIDNAFGYVFSGTYCEWFDHCFFRNNTQCGLLTPGAFSAPPITGGPSGAGPTSAVKVSHTDVQNTVANYSTGTENGIIIAASNSTMDHVFVSLVSQIAIGWSCTESGLENHADNITIYGSGSGIVLNGSAPELGGTLTNVCMFSTSQKTNWSGYVSRQAPLDIMSGSWKIENVYINHNLLGPTGIPPYTIYLGDSGNNNLGIISIRKLSLQNGYATALKHDSPFSQSNLHFIVRDSPGINPDKLYDSGGGNGSVTFGTKNGNFIRHTLQGNITVTLEDGASFGDELILYLIQDGTGSRTVTWPSSFKKAGGALVLTTAANAVDVVRLRWYNDRWIEMSRSMNIG